MTAVAIASLAIGLVLIVWTQVRELSHCRGERVNLMLTWPTGAVPGNRWLIVFDFIGWMLTITGGLALSLWLTPVVIVLLVLATLAPRAVHNLHLPGQA